MKACNINTNLLIKHEGRESIITGESKIMKTLIRWIKEYRNYEEINEDTFLLYTDVEFRGCKLKAKKLGCYIIEKNA